MTGIVPLCFSTYVVFDILQIVYSNFSRRLHFSTHLTKQVIHACLSYLPIKGDLIEAKGVHELLCSLVKRQLDMELQRPYNRYVQ
ncbi:putative armadillo-like helical protein [Helianthus annuus]|nr:putative armadillo-like helical protein [Helianthus annuus]